MSSVCQIYNRWMLLLMVFFVDSDAIEECNYTVVLNPNVLLQNAMDSIMSQFNESARSCVTVKILHGEYDITSQTLFNSRLKDFEFVGVGGRVVVACSYVTKSNYTWYFKNMSTLTFRGIYFENCPRPLRLDTIENVIIEDSTFRYFTEAALDIFNCHIVLITNSVLEHNSGSGRDNSAFRGNSGGVAIGYNDLPHHFMNPIVNVSNSTFYNNTATASSTFLTTPEVLKRGVFTGRGGSMAIYGNESHTIITISITDCEYTSNSARSYGGGLYIYFSENLLHFNKVLIRQTQFMSNIAYISGGGLLFSQWITVIDSTFTNNTARVGGGIVEANINTRIIDRNVYIRNTTFSGNNGFTNEGTYSYGAALAISVKTLLLINSIHEISNCNFTRNAGNSVVYSQNTKINFTGQNNFVENSGPSITLDHSMAHLLGEIKFINNNATEGSALYMLSFSQLVFGKGLSMVFDGNSGRLGACIEVTTQSKYKSPSATGNPLCPFLYEDKSAAPQEWTDVTVEFANNMAILGSAIYMSQLDVCSWYSKEPPFINDTYLLKWPIWQMQDTNRNTAYSESQQKNSTLSVQTVASRLVVDIITVKAWPGYHFSISIGGEDEFGHSTLACAKFLSQPLNITDTVKSFEILFTPEIGRVCGNCSGGRFSRNITLFYQISRLTTDDSTIHDFEGLLGIVHVKDATDSVVKLTSFTLETLMCPAGYSLHPNSTSLDYTIYECKCNGDLEDIITCKDEEEIVVIKRGKWAVFRSDMHHSNMEFHDCPMGYCQCHLHSIVGRHTCAYIYYHKDPNFQCDCNRKGVLCGECRDESRGVSALLNRCVTCSNTAGLLILGLILADAVVLYHHGFTLSLSMYSFMDIGKYLYYLGSATSFYFIYDFCLYEKMSSEMAYFLRYLPLFVTIVICIPVIFTRSNISTLILKKAMKYHGLWLIFFLCYAHNVYTSMTVLNCRSITTNTNRQHSSRLYVNGEVECFTGGHLALALLAILVLLAALLLLPFTVLVTSGILKSCGMEHFNLPLSHDYQDGWKWWVSMKLGFIFLVILFSVISPQNKAAGIMVVAVYTAMCGYVQPYKSRLANVLETAVNVNFLVLLSINAIPYFYDDLFTFSHSDDSSSGECGETGIAVVCWLMMPVYYLPLLGACLTAIGMSTLFIGGKLLKRSPSLKDEADDDSTNVTASGDYTSWTLELPSVKTEGVLDINEVCKFPTSNTD